MNIRTNSVDASVRRFFEDVVQGLRRPDKRLPFQYFYDAEGSALFEAICRQPEYYPATREAEIIARHAADMAGAIGRSAAVVELGSGDGVKTRLLLAELLAPACYVPMDISGEQLERTSETLAGHFPHIPVLPVEADFTLPFVLPQAATAAPRTVFFSPGLTLWNLDIAAREELLTRLADMATPGGGLLIGVDLVKDAAILEAAYDDDAGVTARFNLNMLERINAELGADFRRDGFRHRARWDAEQARVVVELVSQRPQTVRIGAGGPEFAFDSGEVIVTEYSYKFELDAFAAMMRRLGWQAQRAWTDDERLMAVVFLTAGP